MKAGIALATLATACALPPSEVAWFGDDDGDPDLPIDNPAKPDLDGDGWSVAEGDCDDTNEYVGPWAREKKSDFYEQCDDLDNDCDGEVDVIVAESERHVCAKLMTFEQSLMVDVLFVVDTTDPMSTLYLPNLASGARKILTALAGEPYLNSHVGTITMDADSDTAGKLLTFDGDSFISGANVGPGEPHSMTWAEDFITSTFTDNPTSNADEKGREAAMLALGLGLDSDLPVPNPTFLRDEAHLVIVFLSSNEDQTVDPTVDAFEDELALLKGSLSKVTIHAIMQEGELDCDGDSKPAQKGYTYQTLAQDTAGTVLSICSDMTSGFFEAMSQNSAYEGLETEFPLVVEAQADTVVVTVMDSTGNTRVLEDFALADGNTTLIITADPPPSAGSRIIVTFDEVPP